MPLLYFTLNVRNICTFLHWLSYQHLALYIATLVPYVSCYASELPVADFANNSHSLHLGFNVVSFPVSETSLIFHNCIMHRRQPRLPSEIISSPSVFPLFLFPYGPLPFGSFRQVCRRCYPIFETWSFCACVDARHHLPYAIAELYGYFISSALRTNSGKYVSKGLVVVVRGFNWGEYALPVNCGLLKSRSSGRVSRGYTSY